jgi:hypothetical protein
MKKLISIISILTISAFLTVGCSDTVGDGGADPANTGPVVDLVAGVGGANFDGVSTYNDALGNDFDVQNGRLVGMIDGFSGADTKYKLYKNTFDTDGDAGATGGTLSYDKGNDTAVVFAKAGPNYTLETAATYSFPMQVTMIGKITAATQMITFGAVAMRADENALGAGAGSEGMNGSITVTLANGAAVLSVSGGKVAMLPIAGFALDTDYTLTLKVGNDGSATVGPTVTVLLNGTALASYAAGSTLGVTGGGATAKTPAEWAGSWKAFIHANPLLAANAKYYTTQQVAFVIMLDTIIGSQFAQASPEYLTTTTTGSVDALAIDCR